MKQKWYQKYWKILKSDFFVDEIFWKNEVESNLLVAHTLQLCAIVLAACWVLNFFQVFEVNRKNMDPLTAWSLVELLVPCFICRWFKGEKKWLKYLMMLELVIVLARIDSVLTFDVMLIMLIPVVLSCRYYSEFFTMQISIFSTIMFALSSFCGAYLGMGQVNMNFYDANRMVYTRNIMAQVFFPKWMIYILLASVCFEIAKIGKRMVLQQDEVSRNHARVETELDMAKKIQERALPIVHTLSEGNDTYFELAAKMIPAKEVGGDFYDFLYIDSTHLALMIADVSGKGVPAALFMMVSKLLLDNSLLGATSPAKVLSEVNHQLCEKHLEEMFVTVWLGILDLETGHVVAANAGHEYPIICKKGGNFEIYKDKHGLVLGGMDGIRYKEYEFDLAEGDTLYVYTDGVAEATNIDNEQFGMDRTITSLNVHKDEKLEELLQNVKNDIDAFAGEAPQFDDTTMLAIRLKKFMKKEGITISLNHDAIDMATKYVDTVLEQDCIDEQIRIKAKKIVEEVCNSILKNNSATFADIVCKVDENSVEVSVKDNGLPYDASDKTAEQLEELLSTCQLEYQFENGYNIVSLKWNV